MILTFRKRAGFPLGHHKEFSSTQFDCHCHYPECKETFIEETLIWGLEELIDLLALPRINCGFRCVHHNTDVGGVPKSQHTLGNAADISSLYIVPMVIAQTALKVPVFANGGIGLYSSFVHVDVRGHSARWGKNVPLK